MKKIISLILSIVLVAGILPAGALALNPASAEKSEGYSISSVLSLSGSPRAIETSSLSETNFIPAF